MTTKLGLISDVHSSPVPLKQALDIFDRENVSDIICAGDISGYYETLDQTIDLLIQSNCKSIVGNHDQAYLASHPQFIDQTEPRFLKGLPQTLEFEIEEKRVFVVHAHPPSSQHGGIKLLDQRGEIIQQRKDHWRDKLKDFDYDILIVGHTHQVFAERLGNVFVINPGSTQFNHSCMILSLPELTVKIFSLGNSAIIKCWNFSMLTAPPVPE